MPTASCTRPPDRCVEGGDPAARSHGRIRGSGVNMVPTRIRCVTIAAAVSVTQASGPHTPSQVKIASQPALLGGDREVRELPGRPRTDHDAATHFAHAGTLAYDTDSCRSRRAESANWPECTVGQLGGRAGFGHTDRRVPTAVGPDQQPDDQRDDRPRRGDHGAQRPPSRDVSDDGRCAHQHGRAGGHPGDHRLPPAASLPGQCGRRRLREVPGERCHAQRIPGRWGVLVPNGGQLLRRASGPHPRRPACRTANGPRGQASARTAATFGRADGRSIRSLGGALVEMLVGAIPGGRDRLAVAPGAAELVRPWAVPVG